jgi:hypothetical protein
MSCSCAGRRSAATRIYAATEVFPVHLEQQATKLAVSFMHEVGIVYHHLPNPRTPATNSRLAGASHWDMHDANGA